LALVHLGILAWPVINAAKPPGLLADRHESRQPGAPSTAGISRFVEPEVVAGDDRRIVRLQNTPEPPSQTLAAEARERLAQSVRVNVMDEASFDVLSSIANAAALVRTHYGFDWYEHPDAHQAFLAALTSRIMRHAPKEKPTGKPRYEVQPIVVTDDHKTVGTAIESTLFFERQGGVKSENWKRAAKQGPGGRAKKEGV
jgi:hypothetical protein